MTATGPRICQLHPNPPQFKKIFSTFYSPTYSQVIDTKNLFISPVKRALFPLLDGSGAW